LLRKRFNPIEEQNPVLGNWKMLLGWALWAQDKFLLAPRSAA
jgi:hypothetical protein